MVRKARFILRDSKSGEQNEPKAITKQEFGRRLQRHMLERNWNQSDLARAAGLGRDAISTYVRGRSFPESTSLQKLAEALGTAAQELLPNVVVKAFQNESPALEIKQVADRPDHCWVRVNRLVTMKQALQIMEILHEERVE